MAGKYCFTVEYNAMLNNSPSEIELKGKKVNPCPFCGLSEISVRSEKLDKQISVFWCQCNSCASRGSTRPDRYNAIQCWQKRNK